MLDGPVHLQFPRSLLQENKSCQKVLIPSKKNFIPDTYLLILTAQMSATATLVVISSDIANIWAKEILHTPLRCKVRIITGVLCGLQTFQFFDVLKGIAINETLMDHDLPGIEVPTPMLPSLKVKSLQHSDASTYTAREMPCIKNDSGLSILSPVKYNCVLLCSLHKLLEETPHLGLSHWKCLCDSCPDLTLRQLGWEGR